MNIGTKDCFRIFSSPPSSPPRTNVCSPPPFKFRILRFIRCFFSTFRCTYVLFYGFPRRSFCATRNYLIPFAYQLESGGVSIIPSDVFCLETRRWKLTFSISSSSARASVEQRSSNPYFLSKLHPNLASFIFQYSSIVCSRCSVAQLFVRRRRSLARYFYVISTLFLRYFDVISTVNYLCLYKSFAPPR